MVRANAAEVFWDENKKAWTVRIHVGEEAVRRACKGARRDADDDTLRALAIETAHDDGYELSAENVGITR